MHEPSYQRFPERPGDSDSSAKLERIRLPENLAGKSLLDIGCNEGFFCQEAWRRGASRVVGVDVNAEFIERARRRDVRTDYRTLDWADLSSLNETFDVILLLSALHYAARPASLLQDVLNLLQPDGLFVLECGVVPGPEQEWVRVKRPVGDVVLHPTLPRLLRALRNRGAAVRPIGSSVNQLGDPIERRVFHVHLVKSTVLLISGPPFSGKSTLMMSLDYAIGCNNVNLDHLLNNMSAWCRNKTLLRACDSVDFNEHTLSPLIDRIVQLGAEDPFVSEVLSTEIETDAAVTIIEGAALLKGEFRAAFTARLRERGCYVWNVEPAGPRH